MVHKYKFISSVLFAAITLLVSACGGSNKQAESNLTTERPHFSWVNAVAASGFSPVGKIDSTSPEFTWVYNRRTGVNVHSPFKIGFGHNNGTGWQVFTVDRSCTSSPQTGNNLTCSATLPHEFNAGDEIAWWVQYDTRNGWKWDNNAHVFQISGGNGGGSVIPVQHAPVGDISTGQPIFQWEAINVDTLTIGLEKQNGSEWQQFKFNGKLNCPAQARNEPRCWRSDYRLPIAALSSGDYTWWIRANGKAWSSGADFTISSAGNGGSSAKYEWSFNRRGVDSSSFIIGYSKADGSGWTEKVVRKDTGEVTCGQSGNKMTCNVSLSNVATNGDTAEAWVALKYRTGWFWVDSEPLTLKK